MEETNELIEVWECPHCGLIIRNRKPNQCSCGRNNWMRNSPVEGLIKRELQKATIKAKRDERNRILDLVEEWSRNSIMKYDDDCPYCQRHTSNVVICSKELKQKIGELYTNDSP